MAVFLLVLCNFLLSAPRGVMLDDDGYFILAAYFNGVAHPPGYPLYTFIAHLFTHVPVGSVAFRVHVCSAVIGALACAVLWRLMLSLSGSRLAAWLAALAFACSGTFWSQATVAEVYSLNALLVFLLLWWCVDRGIETSPWQGLVLGLALANHWPLVALTVPALCIAAWPQRRKLLRRPGMLAAAFCFGLLPYAWMVYRSRVSEIAFFGPIDDWHTFWFYLSRHAYVNVDQSGTSGWSDKLHYAGFALQESVRQFGWPMALLGAAGFVRQWRAWPPATGIALTLAFAGHTVVLALLLGFDWDLQGRNAFAVYPIIAHGILALWIALGAHWLLEWINAASTGGRAHWLVKYALVALVSGSVWLKNAPAGYRAQESWAPDYARTLLMDLPPHSALFLYGDYSTGPVAYLNRVERVRPDVEIFSSSGQLFSNRLFSPHGPAQVAIAATAAFMERDQRPVFYSVFLPFDRGTVLRGLYSAALRDQSPGSTGVQLTPAIEEFFERLYQRGEPRDPSALLHYRLLGAQYCRAIAVMSLRLRRDEIAQHLVQRCSGFHGLLEQAGVLMESGATTDPAVLKLLQQAQRQSAQAVTRESVVHLEQLLARARQSRR